MDFFYSEREELLSPIGVIATDLAWLPGPDGKVHCPAEITLDHLPAGFKRDEALAVALGMAQQPAVPGLVDGSDQPFFVRTTTTEPGRR